MTHVFVFALLLLHLPFFSCLDSNRRIKDRLWKYVDHIQQNQKDVQELYVSQRLNHFNAADARHFQQRYFRTNRYAMTNHINSPRNKTAFSFLCVGGEGPSLDESVLVDSAHCSGDMLELASLMFEKGYSVYVYALEHRYYGKSYPDFTLTSPVSNEHLHFLSSEQALADVAHFVTTMSSQMTSETKWVTFGGSYPGMLAAWARYKYPHLIYGAVSNSAPVQAVLDFAAYKNHMNLALGTTSVGGSSDCQDIIRNGHQDLADMVADPSQHQEIGQLFKLCDPKSLEKRRNIELFVGEGVIDINVQGNDPSCSEDLCNIAKICSALIELKKNSTNVGALAAVARLQIADRQETCSDYDWEAELNYIASPHRGQKGGVRSWLWQTCTEFGFYQTCGFNSSCPFGQGFHHLDQDFEICSVAFGRTPEQVMSAVQETLERYGGWKLDATRILSVTGEVDPWSELAIQTRHNNNLPTYQVPGASHHFWTHTVKESDDAEITKAREIIYETVSAWLEV